MRTFPVRVHFDIGLRRGSSRSPSAPLVPVIFFLIAISVNARPYCSHGSLVPVASN